ncbi:MAG: hypothetical protein IIW24_00840 [Lachnospiraceae bacterium]|nr:hypothetical protein [Lachnospiraceae bacterium]MBQ5805777.1 hypothetical protein [Lachnospiraceae bacterium]
MKSSNKIPFAMVFSVGCVLFSSHAGGGFATGNQANTYYVNLGWLGPVSAIISMLLLTLTMRQAMIMYNSRQIKSAKQLFETLFHPFDKLEWLFEAFFYIMVLMAIAAAISGAASALNSYFGLNYNIGILTIGILVMLLTIFGADLIRKVSSYMSIGILVTAIIIYAIGIFNCETPVTVIMADDFAANGFSALPAAIKNAFVYAGFQCVTLPTLVACGTPLTNKKGCADSMWISFVMNAVALTLSVVMLMGWESVYTSVSGGTTIPTLTSCTAMGATWLTVVYGCCLLLCLISTGVTITFGFVSRFENAKFYKNISSATTKNAISAIFIIALSMTISLVGLTNIIKYGYGYCGYLGIAVIVIPFLTVGYYKNKTYMAEHSEEFDAAQ